jgi:hypothetical protein
MLFFSYYRLSPGFAALLTCLARLCEVWWLHSVCLRALDLGVGLRFPKPPIGGLNRSTRCRAIQYGDHSLGLVKLTPRLTDRWRRVVWRAFKAMQRISLIRRTIHLNTGAVRPTLRVGCFCLIGGIGLRCV